MKKRQFLLGSAAAGILPAAAPAIADVARSSPVLLTIGGSISKGNRGPVDPVLDPYWAVHEADSIGAFKDKPVKERFALCPWGLYYIDVAQA